MIINPFALCIREMLFINRCGSPVCVPSLADRQLKVARLGSLKTKNRNNGFALTPYGMSHVIVLKVTTLSVASQSFKSLEVIVNLLLGKDHIENILMNSIYI